MFMGNENLEVAKNLKEGQKLDENLVEIMNKIKKDKNLTKEEIAKLESDAKQSLNFLKLIDDIKLPTDRYVVFTDGEIQLVYENGEFFIVSSTDSTKLKKKKKRSEATNMYIEYFIRYILNRINKQKEMDMMVKEISSSNVIIKNGEDVSKSNQLLKDNEREITKLEKEKNIDKEMVKEKSKNTKSKKNKDDLVR